MIHLFKDRYRLGLVLATLFLAGILISAYQIYRLPHNLMLPDRAHPAFLSIYLALGVTFLIGAVAVLWALNSKNEVIVFRDKELHEAFAREDNETSAQTISLDLVKENLKQARQEKDILHAGLQAICKQLEAGQGAAYVLKEQDGIRKLELKTGYALTLGESTVITYEVGEGLIGQSAAGGKTLYIDDVPADYIKIISGLGSASPRYLLIVPVKQQDQVLGVLEVASFAPLSDHQRKFVEDSAQLMAEKITGKSA